MSKRDRPANLFAIFITVFVDLLAFGLVIPDIQLRGRSLGLHGWELGVLLGVYSLAQLLTAPFLGRLSDRIGRRPVLLVTTTLSTIAFLFYAHADHFYAIMVARVLAGVAGGNLGVAYAYVADVTEAKDRAKGMGMIGAAFGLGFILGPAAGGMLVQIGHDKPILLGYTAACLAFVNFLYVYFLLPEPPRHREASSESFLGNLKRAFATPNLALLLAMFFAANLGFTNLETTYFQLLASKNWIFADVVHGDSLLAKHWGSYLLAYVGIIVAFMQGFLVRKLTPKIGEIRIVRYAYWALIPAFALTPFARLWGPHLSALFVLAVANGLLQPNLSSLVSRSASIAMQGSIFGVTQALGACARMIGPLISNSLFDVQPYLPYVVGAGIILFPAIAAWKVRSPDQGPSSGEPALAH